MNRSAYLIFAAVALMAVFTVSCAQPGTYSDTEVAEAAKDLRVLVPVIEAGLALVKPDDPTSRALTPLDLKTTGLSTGAVAWPYAGDTPAEVYAAVGGTGTKRFPPSGYYELTSGNQLYFTLTKETAVGATYYRVILYTYPAFDLVVAHTIEEYIVNSAGTEGWAWANLDLSKTVNRWISLTTVYMDGTTGSRTVEWVSTDDTTYYEAFPVGTPAPADKTSFDGYRYDESGTPPVSRAGSESYSSSVTESVKGKGTVVDSMQYYTETTDSEHSGLTYVIKDKKRKWSEDIRIVTRMEEDTAAGSKTIRSVGEVGSVQYYIDKVDIQLSSGLVQYTSTHDVYNTAVPRGGDPKAQDYVSLSLEEDSAGSGTFTGTLEETKGKDKLQRAVTIARDNHFRFAMTLGSESSTARSLGDELAIPITQQDLSSLSIALPGIEGTFDGYYEAGSLFGTVTAGGWTYDVVVADEGVAVDDRLFEY